MPSSAPAPDAAHADIGIVCALPIELGSFLSRCERPRSYAEAGFTFRGGIYDGIRIAVAESGTGMARARKATEALLAAHSPTWVVSCGFAGALRPDLHVGDMLVVDHVVNGAGHELQIDVKMAADPHRRLSVGRLLTTDKIVHTAVEKKQLAESSGALAVDMETWAVASVCRDRKQKFLAFRVISDDAATDLPPEIASIFGDTGAVRLGAVVGSLWKRPSSAKDMWRLREHALQAAERLADFLDGVVKQLHAARG